MWISEVEYDDLVTLYEWRILELGLVEDKDANVRGLIRQYKASLRRLRMRYGAKWAWGKMFFYRGQETAWRVREWLRGFWFGVRHG